jgi:hypothetical protein
VQRTQGRQDGAGWALGQPGVCLPPAWPQRRQLQAGQSLLFLWLLGLLLLVDAKEARQPC